MTPDLLSVVLRALGFVALFQAVGAGFFLAAFGGGLNPAQASIRRLARSAAAAGAALVLAHLGLEATRMSGDFAGLGDPDLQYLAWTGKAGISQLLQVVGLVAMLLVFARPVPHQARWASCAGMLAIGAFLIVGHTSGHPLRAVLAPLLAVHLLVVAFWFGSLVPLALAIRLENRAAAATLLERFSALATALVPLILVAGLAMAWLLGESLAFPTQPYGELLLAKLAGFGVLMVLAGYNKWRLAPRFNASGAASPLRRSIAVEYCLIVSVLSVTAVMTAFYSPG